MLKKILFFYFMLFLPILLYSQNWQIDTFSKSPICNNEASGIISIKVKGGVKSPLTYLWSDGITGAIGYREQLNPGKYNVTVTDSSIPKVAKIYYFNLRNPLETKVYYHYSCTFSNRDGVYLEGFGFEHHYTSVAANIDSATNVVYPATGWNNEKQTYKYTNKVIEDKVFVIDQLSFEKSFFLVDARQCTTKTVITFPKDFIKPLIQMGADTVILEKGDIFNKTLEVNLNISPDSIYSYKWQQDYEPVICNNCTSVNFIATKNTYIRIDVDEKHKCGLYDDLYVLFKHKNINPDSVKSFAPTIFSPNDDGINDQLTIYGAKDVAKVISMRVFDQWGGLVFEQKDFPPNDNHYGWDGTYKGIPANQGIYTCSFVLLLTDGKEKIVNSSVQLSR